MTFIAKNLQSMSPVVIKSRVTISRNSRKDKTFRASHDGKSGVVTGFVIDKILQESEESILVRVMLDGEKNPHDFWIEEIQLSLF